MIKKPRLDGPYIPVYRPSGDVFQGPDSRCFKAGRRYEDWVPNDFTVVKGPEGRWHAVGITHPAPEDYLPPSSFNFQTIHDAEWQLFHAVSGEGRLQDVIRAGAWKDRGKLLGPAERPREPYEIYAPHIVERNGVYHMVYGPNPMRRATSTDLTCWTPAGPLFSGHDSIRDPNVLPWRDGYRMTYVSENRLLGRSSRDLARWSAPEEVFAMDREGVPESPCVVLHEGVCYLFWCVWDGANGPYDNRTFVYWSDNPCRFSKDNFLTQLEAHAPEVIQGESGEWYLFSAERPARGVSAARLVWE